MKRWGMLLQADWEIQLQNDQKNGEIAKRGYYSEFGGSALNLRAISESLVITSA